MTYVWLLLALLSAEHTTVLSHIIILYELHKANSKLRSELFSKQYKLYDVPSWIILLLEPLIQALLIEASCSFGSILDLDLSNCARIKYDLYQPLSAPRWQTTVRIQSKTNKIRYQCQLYQPLLMPIVSAMDLTIELKW